jgi:Protein of unknown function (DUF1759)
MSINTIVCVTSSREATSKHQKVMKLPKIEISRFPGDVAGWPQYWSIFDKQIHKSGELSDAAKFRYLVQLLKGKALATIWHLQITSKNYLPTMGNLKN